MSRKTTLSLELKDQVSGKTTVVVLSMEEAKRLYLGLREMFGDYQRPDPELFITPPKIELAIGDRKQPSAA
jgi:hypothetical protein